MEITMRHVIALAAILSALVLAVPVASAAGTGKFCLKGEGTEMNCNFRTMASCDKARKGNATCVANSSSTTGSGTTSTKPARKY
jgi:hypothetical protein